MKASTPIARMVQTMLAEGVPPDAIVSAVEGAEAASSPQRGGRGMRLPAGWEPSTELIRYALAQGFSLGDVEVQAEKFKNYWLAKAGASAVKRDWGATWRNWILNAVERRNAGHSGYRAASGAPPTAGSRPTGADAVIAGMGRLAHQRAANRHSTGADERPMASGGDSSGQPDLEYGGT
jgi:hypothetical protein